MVKTGNSRAHVRTGRAALCLCGWMLLAATAGAEESYCFRLYLKDKGVSETAVASPEKFLSPEAMERRTKRNVEVSLSDVPIASSYIEQIASAGVRIVTQSKWMASVVVECEDSVAAGRLAALPIVDSLLCVWKGADRLTATACMDDTSRLAPSCSKLTEEYGYGAAQLNMLNGARLHEAGRRGQGMRVAVVDAGFLHADRVTAFASLRLLGTHNVVFPGHDVFCEDDHGTKVLSCLAANLPGVMVGAAPEASYLLIKSEDTRTEYPIEEDYWAAAVEYADSAGVDILSTSLGYYLFDMEEMRYTAADLDGQTAFITRVAQTAADKGMLIFCSAGNEGGHDWEKITFPSDARDILTVGSIDDDEQLSSFSSKGFTADYRVKPDVVALGSGVCVIDATGNMEYTNGTSFSTPVVAGLSACLWQALPWLDNREVIDLIRRTASQSERPDAERGYGIPNIYKAYTSELNGSVQ